MKGGHCQMRYNKKKYIYTLRKLFGRLEILFLKKLNWKYLINNNFLNNLGGEKFLEKEKCIKIRWRDKLFQ